MDSSVADYLQPRPGDRKQATRAASGWPKAFSLACAQGVVSSCREGLTTLARLAGRTGRRLRIARPRRSRRSPLTRRDVCQSHAVAHNRRYGDQCQAGGWGTAMTVDLTRTPIVAEKISQPLNPPCSSALFSMRSVRACLCDRAYQPQKTRFVFVRRPSSNLFYERVVRGGGARPRDMMNLAKGPQFKDSRNDLFGLRRHANRLDGIPAVDLIPCQIERPTEQ
jgi:hypothetical protein